MQKKKKKEIDQHDDVIYFQIGRRRDIKFPDINKGGKNLGRWTKF